MRTTQWPLIMILFVVAIGGGCSGPKAIPDPLAGWKLSRSQDPAEVSRAIRDDYEAYVRNLPPERNSFFGSMFFFENDKGQRAVHIKRGVDGKWWNHVLIYDAEDKRVELVVYSRGGYRS